MSMTGFGAAEVALAEYTLRVELRSVNHRHLDVRLRLPSELADFSHLVDEIVRLRCVRGRVEVHALFRGSLPSGHELDIERARTAYHELLRLRDELAPGEPVPFAALLKLPGLFKGRVFDVAAVEQALRSATERACVELATMRMREGAALCIDLQTRIARLRAETEAVQALRPAVLEGARVRLQKRMEKLLEGSALELDPARLAQEAAWFAERSDVAEELTRLASHFTEFERTLEGAQESVGRKLDFMVQEIGRELNTLGAKANDADMSRSVVELKAELERIREQVQNIL